MFQLLSSVSPYSCPRVTKSVVKVMDGQHRQEKGINKISVDKTVELLPCDKTFTDTCAAKTPVCVETLLSWACIVFKKPPTKTHQSGHRRPERSDLDFVFWIGMYFALLPIFADVWVEFVFFFGAFGEQKL